MRRFAAILLGCSVTLSATMATGYGGDRPDARGLSARTTNALIHQLRGDFQRCFRLEKNYRYDCYDDAYFRGARKLRQNPDYAPVEEALDEVGRKIRAIVEENADPSMPPLRKGFNTYRPIKTEALPASKARVVEAIEEAQTVLLRAPDDNGEHFQRIAAALESNKVLLRSALLLIGTILRLV